MLTPLAGTAADWAWLALVFPLVGFLANGALALRAPHAKRAVSVIGVGSVVAAFVVSVAVWFAVARGAPDSPHIVSLWTWIPAGPLRVELALHVDQLSALMLLVVTGVGSLIHLYSVGYMGADPGYARYFSYLNLFVLFMLVLVLGASFPVMFIGWEGVGLCSYLLIGFWYGDRANADAGKKAFIMNRIGDAGFILAMCLLWWQLRSLDYVVAFERADSLAAGGTIVTGATLLLFLGATGKSAQIPLYTWLPDAMAGPTPVSALIHAATMVTAGVYLVARCGVLFALAPLTSAIVAGIGVLTALVAATIALTQWDIKKVLAYSTISQLGYMFLGVGAGAYAAGIFHLTTHAFFKALLFLAAGSVIHALHHAYDATGRHDDPQDMRNMGGLREKLPWTFAVMLVGALALAGAPPFAGFVSKDGILATAFARGHDAPLWYVYWGIGIVTAALTAFYSMRLVRYTFLGANRTGEAERSHLREVPWVMTGPLVLLALLSVVGGALNLPAVLPRPELLARWLEPVTEAAHVPAVHLSHATEWALLGVGAVVALAAIGAAFVWLKPETLSRASQAPPATGIARVSFRGYFVDDLYNRAVVRPCVWLARRVLWRGVDDGVIDGAGVNGSAWIARGFGRIGSWLQTGQLGTYLTVFVLGVILVLWAVR
jgi:NADH-quinone oxidoreductase subunit L